MVERMTFEVESTMQLGQQVYVLARRLEGHDELNLTAGSTLADAPLAECLELPHLPSASVSRFEERTVFCLANANDLARFPKHAHVELRLG
jgi:hypothetical protein